MRLAVVLLLVSCKAELGGTDVDAAVDAPPDVAIDAPVPLGPWGTPTPMTITPVSDDDPTATSDLLELYFNRNQDIYVAKRAASADAWGVPQLVTELSAPEADTTPEVSYDGLTMYLASARPPTLGANDIWVSTRASRQAAWSAPVHVSELSSTAAEGSTASSDGLVLVMDSQRDTAGISDVYIARRATATAPWGTPAPLAELNVPASTDGNPMLSANGLTIYFDSSRGADPELFVATRPTTAAPFGAPSVITELSSTSTENDPWISPDGRTMYFTSNRDGTQRLWESHR